MKIASLTILTYLFVIVGFYSDKDKQYPDWELRKIKDEISIYTRKVNYSNYEEFKSEMIVESSSDVLIQYLRNIEEYKKWLPDCLESRRLNLINDTSQINYILTDVPWPYEDRGFVYKFTAISIDSNKGQYKVLIENRPDYIPERKHIVRIPRSNGFWLITALDNNQIKVVYQMHVEPGGYVPAWLYNMKIVDTPYTFMNNLRIQLEKHRNTNTRIKSE